MDFTQVADTSVTTNNSPSQGYNLPGDQPTTNTISPVLRTFTIYIVISLKIVTIKECNLSLQVSGVWERPSASVIYWLFGGELFINVRTALYRKGEIRGQVRQLPYGGHHVSYQGRESL